MFCSTTKEPLFRQPGKQQFNLSIVFYQTPPIRHHLSDTTYQIPPISRQTAPSADTCLCQKTCTIEFLLGISSNSPLDFAPSTYFVIIGAIKLVYFDEFFSAHLFTQIKAPLSPQTMRCHQKHSPVAYSYQGNGAG